MFLSKKVIIFDLDGTLINSSPDLANAINHMLNSLGLDTFSEETIHTWVGNGAKKLVERSLGDANAEFFEKALEIFLKYYKQNLCVDTVTYPKVSQTLKILKDRDYILTIVTNKPYEFIAPILKNLEIFDYFEYFIGSDSLKEKKPSPMPLKHICDKFSVSINDALMVGDSKNDILAAKACDMQSIGVSYGYNYGENISIYNPDIVIDNFEDLLKVL